MRRPRIKPWHIGLVTLMLALGVSLTTTARMSRAQGAPVSGEDVFVENCQVCHGVKASGRIGPPLNQLPPELANLPPEVIAGELTGLVRNGIPGAMPRFLPEQLNDAQILELTKYLVSLNNSVPSPSLYEALEPITEDAAAGRTWFPETGHSAGGEFRSFWMRYGGLRVFGLPVSEEYNGVSPEDGQVYRMQMFERARFELHEDAPGGPKIQLALLGAEELRLRMHFLLRGGGEGGGPPATGQ
jgi:mono/diheme cytochrome c family protein